MLRNFFFDKALVSVFLSHIGLTYEEIGFVLAAQSLSALVFEIPAGVFADKTSYGHATTVGLVLAFVFAVGIVFASAFWFILALFMINGSSRAFISGADHAALYSFLLKHGKSSEFSKFEGRARLLGGVALAVAMGVGGLVYEIQPRGVYVLYSLSLIGAVYAWHVFALRVDGYKGAKDHQEQSPSLSITSTFFHHTFRTQRGRSYLAVVAMIAVLAGIVSPFYAFSQAPLSEFTGSVLMMCLVYAFIELVSALFNSLANGIEKWFSFTIISFVCFGIIMIGLALAALGPDTMLLLVGFALVVIVLPVFDVILTHFLHRRVHHSVRATSLSVAEFLFSLIIAVSYVVAGKILSLYGHSALYSSMFVLTLGTLIVCLVLTNFGRALKPYHYKVTQ